MVDSKLFNYWVLTGQENKGTRVYTPKKAALGNTQQTEKEGFEIKENGEFIKYEISPAGRPMRYIGHYEISGNTLSSYFKNHYI